MAYFKDYKIGDMLIWRSSYENAWVKGIIRQKNSDGTALFRIVATSPNEKDRDPDFHWHDNGITLLKRASDPLPNTFMAKNKEKITFKVTKI